MNSKESTKAVDGFVDRLARISALHWLLGTAGGLILASLLSWGFVVFGLKSQCGGGYGSCTSTTHTLLEILAPLCLGGAGLLLLLALGCLLMAISLGVRHASAAARTICLLLTGAFLLIAGAVVWRIGAPMSAIAAYGLLVLLITAAVIAGWRSGLRSAA